MWSLVYGIISRLTFVDWILLIGALLGALYVYGTWTYDFAEKRGLPGLRPKLPFLGSTWGVFAGRHSFMSIIKELYDKAEGHPVLVFYEFRKPFILIRDPDVLRHITVKDFDHFANHRPPLTDTADPFVNKNLVALKDEAWKQMRATLSPAFTTSKLRVMFELMSNCGKQLADYIRQEHIKTGGSSAIKLDTKDLFTRFANDVIATAAFGVSCDSLMQPKNEFYLMGKDLTTPSTKRMLIIMGFLIFPRLMKSLGFNFIDPKPMNFFDTLIKETVKEREKKSIYRPDVLQLLMQARNAELRAEPEDEKENQIEAEKQKLTDEDISAQTILFFFAGFETVSVALVFIAYAMAVHQDVQRRLQEEVDKVMEETEGKLTYEIVQGMKYLDMVISEVLRLYPPGVASDRQCGSSCTVPAIPGRPALRFQKGDLIWIPMSGYHRDPKYWQDPERFDPERFNDENRQKIKPFTYMPFGVGPRICIGQRMAVLELKIALIHLMANFDISRPGSSTDIKYAKGIKLMPEDGYDTYFTPRTVK